jgi:hypothetical protein
MRLTKEQSRERYRGLRELVAEWDPLGLIALGSPRDEYDCIVGPLMRQLEQKATVEDISAYLQHEFANHFGVSRGPDATARAQFAQRARAWFSEHWRDSTL